MDGLVAGLYEIVPALQKVEVMKNIVIGCALVFGASSLGNMLMEWFS